MKKLYLILLTSLIAIGGHAQSWFSEGWRVGAFGGATSFAGDIMYTHKGDHHRISDTRYDFGLDIEKQIIPGFNFRLIGSYGNLEGYKDFDAIGKPMYHAFNANFIDYHIDLKLDALKLIFSENFPFSAYGLFGIGGISYKSEWWRTNTNKLQCDTSATSIIYPIGIGTGFDIGSFQIFAEGTWNVTFTDALDAQISNNSDHKIQDSYLTFTIGATYEFGANTSSRYKGHAGGKVGSTRQAQKHKHSYSKSLHKSTSAYRKRATSSKHHYNNGGRTQVKSNHVNSNLKKKYPIHY